MSQTPGVGASNPQIFWSATRFDQEPAKNGDAAAPTLASLQTKVATQTTHTEKAAATRPSDLLATESLQQAESPYQTLNETASPLPPANLPVLQPATGDIRLAEQFSFQDTIQNLATQYPQTPLTPDKSFALSVEQQTALGGGGPVVEQMSEAAGKLEMSLLQVQAQVNFAITHPDVPMAPEIRTIAQQVSTQAVGQVQQKFGLSADWQPSMENLQKEGEFTDSLIGASSYAKFMAMAGKDGMNGISREKLLFAQEHPELEGLDPETAATAQALNQETTTAMSQTFGAPEGWTPAKAKKGKEKELTFNDTRVSGAYIEEFEEQLTKLVKKGKLSNAEATQIRTKFYNPDAEVALDGKLSEISNEVVGKAHAKIKDKYGVPDSYTPLVPKRNYDDVIKGVIAEKFSENVASGNYNLSQADQQQFLSVLHGEKSIDSIQGDKKATFEKITQETLNSVNEMYGVNYTELPTIPVGIVAAVNDKSYVRGKSAIRIGQEFLHGKMTYSGVPNDDPNRVLVLDAMKVIGEALDAISRIYTESAIASSEAAKRVSTGQMDIQLNKLDKQRIQIQEQIEQFEKQQTMAALGPLMDIIMVVMATLTGGALGFLFAIAFVIINHTIGMDKFIQAITDFLHDVFGLPKFLAKLLVVFIMIWIVSSAGLMVTLDLGMQIIMESKILQDFLALFGASEEAQQIFAMVVMVLMMIATIAISFFFPPAAMSVAPEMAMNMAINMIGRILLMIAKMVMKILEAIMKILEPIMKVLRTVAKAIIQMMKFLVKMMQTADDAVGALDDAGEMALNLSSKVASKAAPSVSRAAEKGMQQGSKFEQALAKMQEWLSKMEDAIDAAQKAASQGSDSGDGLGDLASVGGKMGGKAGKASPQKLFTSLKEGLKEIGQGFKDDALSAFEQTMKNAEEDALRMGKQFKSPTLEKLGSKLGSQTYGKAAKAADDAGGALGKAADDAAGTISETGDTLTDATKGVDDMAKGSDDAARAASTAAKGFSKYNPEKFVEFMGDKMRHIMEDIGKMKEDMIVFFRGAGKNMKPTELDEVVQAAGTGGKALGKAKTPSQMISWERFSSAITDKANKIAKSLTDIGMDDIGDMFKGIGRSFKDAGKAFDDITDEAVQILKKDPSKWGDANAALTRALARDSGQMAMKVMEVLTGIIQMVTSAVQFFNSLILADMAKRIAQLEAAIKQMDAIIAIMKTVINDLMKDAENLGKLKQSVQELQAKKWTQLSQVMSKLMSANSASSKG